MNKTSVTKAKGEGKPHLGRARCNTRGMEPRSWARRVSRPTDDGYARANIEAHSRMRAWLGDAVKAKGAEVTSGDLVMGSGTAMGHVAIGIKLEGYGFHICITPYGDAA